MRKKAGPLRDLAMLVAAHRVTTLPPELQRALVMCASSMEPVAEITFHERELVYQQRLV